MKPMHSHPTSIKPSDVLREELFKRKEKNPSYSIRAFARDLGMSQPLLTWVLSEKRPLTLKQAYKIVTLLGFTPDQENKFLELVSVQIAGNPSLSKKMAQARNTRDATFTPIHLELEKFRLISRWYHLAILNLSTLKNFKSDPAWISNALGISSNEARDAVYRLKRLGYLKEEKGSLTASKLHLKIDPGTSTQAVRAYHEEMTEKAAEELKKTDPQSFEKRDITSISLAVDSNRIPEAKEFLAWVRDEMRRRFTTGEIDSVYQLNLQLFPITKDHENEKKDSQNDARTGS